MKADMFTPTHCDCCGREFDDGETFAEMMFSPSDPRARAEYVYAACRACELKVTQGDPVTLNRAVAACIQRCPEILEFAQARGTA